MNLSAGDVHFRYGDGEIRTVVVDGQEVIRRVYVAVRDPTWGTVRSDVHDTLERHGRRGQASASAQTRVSEIPFEWTGRLEWEPDLITFRFEGLATSSFLANRIGLCVLIPADLRGTQCWVDHDSGARSTAVLPRSVDHHQPVEPFHEIRRLSYSANGRVVAMTFDGETFEMEDQRNWTDASYKIYCPPLSLPFPIEVAQGSRFSQTWSLKVARRGLHRKPNAGSSPAGRPVRIELGEPVQRMPAVGTCLTTDPPMDDGASIGLLSLARPGHLRVDLGPTSDIAATLDYASRAAHALETKLEVGVAIPTDTDWLSMLAAELEHHALEFSRWLLFPSRIAEDSWLDPATIRSFTEQLSEQYPTSPVLGGYDTDYLHLNRNLPPATHLSGVCFAINPQVHASDDESLIETLPIQAVIAREARSRAHWGDVAIGPISLLARTSGPQPTPNPSLSAMQDDSRHTGLFGAAWTLGSLASLLPVPVSSLTYHETTGRRGLVSNADDGSRPYPVYHVMRDVLEMRGANVVQVSSSDPQRVGALALADDVELRMILANYTDTEVSVELPTLGRAHRRTLDQSTFDESRDDPDAFRARTKTVDAGETLIMAPLQTTTTSVPFR